MKKNQQKNTFGPTLTGSLQRCKIEIDLRNGVQIGTFFLWNDPSTEEKTAWISG
jgi:hypothetical protein